MRELEGKVILITGASSGIGRAAATVFAREGATVVVAARRTEQLEETASEVRSAGGAATSQPVDIASEASVTALFDTVEREFGKLDGVFNNAGVESEQSPLPDTDVDEYDRVAGVNARGTWLCMRAAMRIMRQQGHGAIVNTASIAGLIAFPGASPYVSSKHAVVGMTKSAALDLAAKGIRVNCICPGATRSEMSERWSERIPGGAETLASLIPARRVAEPDEPAELASFLLSDRARYITGVSIAVDGGSSLG